jgi:hypothetical protein
VQSRHGLLELSVADFERKGKGDDADGDELRIIGSDGIKRPLQLLLIGALVRRYRISLRLVWSGE